MGSFSYSCRLSGLPITGGDKAVLIPLIPSNDDYYDNGEAHVRKFGTTHYCSNDGANVFFRPYMFPIFGTYDDYGRLEDIEKDDNTKTLEKVFGLTIEQIVDVICSGRKDDGFDDSLDVVKQGTKKERGDDYGKPKYKKEFGLLIRTSGTWMRREIYDGLSDAGSSGWKDELDLGIPSVLKALGFKETGTSKDERYNRVFTNGPVSLNSDGNWVHEQTNSSQGIYSLHDLKKYCKEKGLDIEVKEMADKSMYEQIYDYILPDANKLNMRGRWEGDRVRSMLLCGRDMFMERDETLRVSEAYFSEIKENGNGFLRKNIADWHKVRGYFYDMGHYFTPVGTSPQCGEPKNVLTVINLAKQTLENDIKERYSEEEELEEENC